MDKSDAFSEENNKGEFDIYLFYLSRTMYIT